MTAPLSVDPTALAVAGSTVGGEGDTIATAVGTLDAALSGAGAMFGHDAAGLVFAQSYTASGKAVLEAAAAAVNACRRVGFGIQTSASNYGHANASSTVGGGTSPVPAPTAPGQYAAPSMPPPLGGGIAAPLGWSLVEAFVGDVWPDGNPGQMHAAANAWRQFGTAVGGLAGQVTAAGPGVSAQQIPEAGQMVSALSQIAGGLGDVATQAQAVAAAVDGFADTVDATQNAVRGLLHQLSPSGILETIGGIFTGHDPMDEVRKVAHEIKTVLDNMKREADASGQIFSQGINLLDSATNSLESWASKEFTNVLGKDVGGALAYEFNAAVDGSAGVLKFVAETTQGISQLDPTRFAYDPAGAASTWQGLLKTTETMMNPTELVSKIVSDPSGSLDTLKGVVDWKDVEEGHPFRALGYDTAQVGSLFIPGVGEAEPAVVAGGVEGRVAAGAGEAETRVAAGATRDAVPGLKAAATESESITTQAGRVGSELDGIKVPESTTPGAAPGASAPAERPPVEAPTPPADAPGGRAPVDTAPPVDTPRPESGPASGGAPETAVPHDAAPAPQTEAAAPHAPESAPVRSEPSAPLEQSSAPMETSPPPSGGAESSESTPSAAADTAPSAPAGHGADMSSAGAAEDRTPVSVGAHGAESADGSASAGHGSGGGSDHGSGARAVDGDHGLAGKSGHDSVPDHHVKGHDPGDPSADDSAHHPFDSTAEEPSGAGHTLEAANNLNEAFANGLPTEDLARQVADGSTHHVGDSDRVVLGKWDGQDGGYIGEARHHGGIYFDTGSDVWNAIEHGLEGNEAKILGWQVNESFLRAQMEAGVSRIEYVLPEGFDNVDQVARVRRETFSALEINFLNENAALFGYVREGNSWVFKGIR